MNEITSIFLLLVKENIVCLVVRLRRLTLVFRIHCILFVYIGQFGLVYKADWMKNELENPTTVAVKTLQGARHEVENLL